MPPYLMYLIDFRKMPEFVKSQRYETVTQAVDEFSFNAWCEGFDNLLSQAVLIKGNNEQIETIGVFIKSAESRFPVLMWIFSNGKIERRLFEEQLHHIK